LTNWCKNQVVIRIPAFAQRKGRGPRCCSQERQPDLHRRDWWTQSARASNGGGVMADQLKAIYRPKGEALDRSCNSLPKKATLEKIETAYKIKAALGAVV